MILLLLVLTKRFYFASVVPSYSAKRATAARIPTPLQALAGGQPQAIHAPRSTPPGAAVRDCYFVKRTFAKWYVRSSSATMSWRQVPAHERSVCHRYV